MRRNLLAIFVIWIAALGLIGCQRGSGYQVQPDAVREADRLTVDVVCRSEDVVRAFCSWYADGVERGWGTCRPGWGRDPVGATPFPRRALRRCPLSARPRPGERTSKASHPVQGVGSFCSVSRFLCVRPPRGRGAARKIWNRSRPMKLGAGQKGAGDARRSWGRTSRKTYMESVLAPDKDLCYNINTIF